jgi:hypothetical protein
MLTVIEKMGGAFIRTISRRELTSSLAKSPVKTGKRFFLLIAQLALAGFENLS